MATDAEIRAAGFKYIPQQQYLLNPFQLPENQEPVTNSGIVNTNAFTYGGGDSGGGVLQVGDPMMNFGNYYNYTGNKYMMNQDRPNLDSYSDNAQKTFMGMPSYRQQELTGPDIGEYIGSNINIPLEQTTAGKIQSGVQGAEKGIKNLMGMLPTPGALLSRLGIKNFNSLSPADQLFIKTNTGYRGPTVFGENTGGGNVDPFGMNVESLFGNYAEGVRDNFSQLQDTLTKDRPGVTFNELTGEFEGEDEDLVTNTNKQTNMIRNKFLFRKKQIEQQEKNQRDIEKANQKAFENQKARSGITSGANDGRYENLNDRDRGGQGAFAENKTSMRSAGRSYQDARGNVGYSRGRKDGGRIGYKHGGLASIL